MATPPTRVGVVERHRARATPLIHADRGGSVPIVGICESLVCAIMSLSAGPQPR
jgi:hypothetical protein